ncbi:hypothetical protein GCM10007981_15980 [Thermocladium modestius]|uniref:Ribosomal RNA large subunit methyltransferase K/L-like methyltransferase domain-containing protein n=1 Tax=Thermocladium modestius TaxID=62609 RepID=A0A830GX75_9CREN|nr:methyltransferase [Thermocladium modestius]GGP21964.1 hypothetical protein GCM10007981_15980 [Thermocladium modestius]
MGRALALMGEGGDKIKARLEFRNIVGKDLPIKELMAVTKREGTGIKIIENKGYEAWIEAKGSDLTKVLPRLILTRRAFDEKGREIYRRRRFLFNDPKAPHLDVEIAMLMVNLAGLGRGDRALDPFSGFNTIGMVGKVLGIDVISMDISNETQAEIRGDATIMPFRGRAFDAVVTDPPFNRIHTVNSRLDNIYYSLIREAEEAIKPGGRVVLIYPSYLSEYVEDAIMESNMNIHAFGAQYMNDAFSRFIVTLVLA